MRQLIAYLICFVLTGMASAQNFTYLPPGNLKPNSGTGLVDYTVYAPGIRFPLETGYAYANSQVYGRGGQFGPGGGQCDKENYTYPWQDNFCEKRDWPTDICPGGKGHQGEDIRAAGCEDDKYWVVAVDDGKIVDVTTHIVTLRTKDYVYYDYLHMSSVLVEKEDKVKRGARLGKVSSITGKDRFGNYIKTKTTRHLHFQVWAHHPKFKNKLVLVSSYLSLIRAYERMMGEKGTEVKNEAPQPPPPPKPVCETPNLHTPQNNATSVAMMPLLNWHPATCGKEWADVYRVQIHTKPAYPPECDDLQTQNTCSKLIALNATTGNSETSVSLTANTLTYNTKYFWRVRAGHTSGGGSAWSSTWNFTTTHEPPVCGECQFSEGWRCLNRADGTLCSLGRVCMDGYCTAKPKCIPQPEICDNKDNDCDGKIDENLTRSCQTICGNGTETCQDGAWINCNAPLPNSCGTCNNTRQCVTACGIGTETCLNGKWVNCTARLPSTETCNNIDDDCNGLSDENLTRQCATACGIGIETCSAGKWLNCTAKQENSCGSCSDSRKCTTACGTGTEQCSNGFWVNCTAPAANSCGTCSNTRPCMGNCGAGTEECQNGQWVNCTAPVCPQCVPVAEVCDNKDNDCNGKKDEGLSRSCSKGCGNGTETCQDGAWINCNAPLPNSCGTCSNTRQCVTACGIGTETCLNGKWVNCTARLPSPETCNNIDDDCNGKKDENLTRSCQTICGNGTETCQDGAWINCNAPLPNSCGTCSNTRQCVTACGIGTETCLNGKWVNCTARLPSTETCNNIDDNCNGLSDENLTRQCATNCGIGTETCVAGVWVNCTAPACPMCGGANEKCCANNQCNNPLVCSTYGCVLVCGLYNRACCEPGKICNIPGERSACFPYAGGTCFSCGATDELCCPGPNPCTEVRSGIGVFCNVNTETCWPCGGEGQTCCETGLWKCAQGLLCDNIENHCRK